VPFDRRRFAVAGWTIDSIASRELAPALSEARYHSEAAEPWRMTQRSFDQWLAERSRAMQGFVNDRSAHRPGIHLMEQLDALFGAGIDGGHEGVIRAAFVRGEQIPEAVLWEYPKLAHELCGWPMPSSVWQTTQAGFLNLVNPQGKMHESGIFDRANLDDIQAYLARERFAEIVGVLQTAVGEIELRAERRPCKYVRKLPDGEIARDASGIALYLNDEEVLAAGRNPFELTIAAFHGDMALGHIGDSFGATELMLAAEYRGYGIGTALEVAFRREDPFRPSGGLSVAGLNCVLAAHRELVREAIAQGMDVPAPVRAEFAELEQLRHPSAAAPVRPKAEVPARRAARR
jgi:hypothetical protein